jgi:DASS family divalent anion:Na+ symporter
MNKQSIKLLVCFCVGALIWNCSHPENISNNAWHLLAIFTSTIFMILLQALPMGAATLTGLTFTILTKTMPFNVAFGGYKNAVPWLILVAFFYSTRFYKNWFRSTRSLQIHYNIRKKNASISLCTRSYRSYVSAGYS